MYLGYNPYAGIFVMYVRIGNFILLRLDFDRTWKPYSIGYHMLWSIGRVYSHVLSTLFVWRLITKHIHDWICWSCVSKIAKATVNFIMSVCLSVRPSVCPNWTTRLSLNGFSWNLMLVDLGKICRDNSSLIEIWQEYRLLYMKTYVQVQKRFDNSSKT
jgi:hypothetical protein